MYWTAFSLQPFQFRRGMQEVSHYPWHALNVGESIMKGNKQKKIAMINKNGQICFTRSQLMLPSFKKIWIKETLKVQENTVILLYTTT